MKALKLTFLATLASIIAITGCQRDAHQDITSNQIKPAINNGDNVASNNTVSGNSNSTVSGKETPVTCNPNAYIVLLESRTQVNGNWEWIWSVQNSNPGNGTNGTFQDLSHWGMQFGACFNVTSLVSAAYSANGTTWTAFTPTYQVDPSVPCLSTAVLKFDYGTIGSAKSYYKLVVSINYPTGLAPGYYKSGSGTGCCTFSFIGIGCAGDDGGPR